MNRLFFSEKILPHISEVRSEVRRHRIKRLGKSQLLFVVIIRIKIIMDSVE